MTPDPDAESGAQADAPADAEQEPGTAKPKPRKRTFWRDLTVIVVVAVALTFLLKTFVAQVFSIPSGSMENTLLPGDRILVSKITYDFRSIARGDIVVFSGAGSWDPPSTSIDYVKRVIGIPGDHVACCNASGQVTVNGVPLSESSYIYPGDVPSQLRFNITVPPGRLWVMGDNRGDSDDSRLRTNDPGGGTVPESAVAGRAFLIIWPLSRVCDLPIPNTFEQAGLSAAAAVAIAPPVPVVGGGAAVAATALAWRRRRR